MRRRLRACPQSPRDQKLLVYDFAQFVMLWQAGVADNREDDLDVSVKQTLAQDALSDHARCSEENRFHVTTSVVRNARTSPNAATIGCMRGTGSQSTDAGKLSRRRPCRRCSIRSRSYKTIGLLCGATSRKVGSGCAAVPKHRASSLLQARDLQQWNDMGT